MAVQCHTDEPLYAQLPIGCGGQTRIVAIGSASPFSPVQGPLRLAVLLLNGVVWPRANFIGCQVFHVLTIWTCRCGSLEFPGLASWKSKCPAGTVAPLGTGALGLGPIGAAIGLPGR